MPVKRKARRKTKYVVLLDPTRHALKAERSAPGYYKQISLETESRAEAFRLAAEMNKTATRDQFYFVSTK